MKKEDKENESSGIIKDSSIEREKKNEEKKLLIYIHILIKNLEAKKVNSEQFKQNMEKIFNDLSENDEYVSQEDVTEKISELFIDNLKPLNSKNTEKIKEIMNKLYDKYNDPNIFKEYLYDALENINDYNNLGEENEKKIIDYIIKRLSTNEKIINKKDELKEAYKKKNYIINYDDFTNIVKQNDIVIETLAMEYLLYKMKCGLSLDGNLFLDNLNFKFVIDLLEQVKKEKNDIQKKNSIKESVMDDNEDQFGISIKRQESLI
jgi:hypothetical protein